MGVSNTGDSRINEEEIKPLADFIAAIDASLPVCSLTFRPNFVFEDHPGADGALMERCVDIAEASGLQSVHWAGQTGIPGKTIEGIMEVKDYYSCKGACIAGSYAYQAG